MSPSVSERSFENAIECALLQYGLDARAGGATAVRETPPLRAAGHPPVRPRGGMDRCLSSRRPLFRLDGLNINNYPRYSGMLSSPKARPR